MDCPLMYRHEKRLIKLDPGTVGLQCWLACLSLYLWEIIIEKYCHIDKNYEDHFV